MNTQRKQTPDCRLPASKRDTSAAQKFDVGSETAQTTRVAFPNGTDKSIHELFVKIIEMRVLDR